MRLNRALFATTLLACSGCRGVNPAPEDLEGLLHYLWEKYPEGSDAELVDALDNLHLAIGGADLEDTLDGSTAPLTDEEVALAGLDREVDPTETAGLFIVDPFPCDVDTAEAILISTEQDVLYDVFDDYERTYTTDLDAYLERETSTLLWEVTYTTTIPMAGPYTADLAGGVRRIPHRTLGDFLLIRSVLVEPAEFEHQDPVFDQDYRIELFYGPRDGTVIHVEALWRNMHAGLANTDSAAVQRFILNSLEDWDDQTAHWCENGLP
ncbi:MAG: hypothetical protein JRJ84_23285 [Deltaproteobacteria bacterium]|nr:hypothetical protein [Deltaproteobacteria bacterium]